MKNITIDELLKKVDSRYMLVSVISKRARQIVEGSDPLIKTRSDNPVSIAMEEFSEDLIEYKE